MIKRIILDNFQSHKKTEMEFHPGVNVIVGSSDTGKTAIIRALRWLVWNRPLGDSFISSWADSTNVTLKQSEGHEITRTKSKNGKNSYSVNEKVLSSIKTEVPEEVTQLLNLKDINLQQQLDRPFLLDSSPGEVAQHFNQVARLDMIDRGIKKVSQWSRKIQQTITVKETQLKEAQEELETFDYLDILEARLSATERAESKKETQKNSVKIMEQLCENIQNTEEEIAEYQELLDMEMAVEGILTLMDERNQKAFDLNDIHKLTIQIYRVEEELIEYEGLLVDETKIDTILKLGDKRNKIEQLIESIQSITTNCKLTQESLRESKSELSAIEKRFREVFPDICPLCGQKVKKGGKTYGKIE